MGLIDKIKNFIYSDNSEYDEQMDEGYAEEESDAGSSSSSSASEQIKHESFFMSRVRRSASTYPKFSPERDRTVLPINDEICIHSPLCYFIAKRRRASKIFLPEKKFFCQMPQKSLINSHECGRIINRWKDSDKTAYWGVAKR